MATVSGYKEMECKLCHKNVGKCAKDAPWRICGDCMMNGCYSGKGGEGKCRCEDIASGKVQLQEQEVTKKSKSKRAKFNGKSMCEVIDEIWLAGETDVKEVMKKAEKLLPGVLFKKIYGLSYARRYTLRKEGKLK